MHTRITYKLLNLLMISMLVVISPSSHASYVSYTHTANTTQITSVPYTQSGFGFSDGSGNSMSFTRTSNAAVMVNQYPNAVWVQMENANVPPNAIILQYINGYPAYYCRVESDHQVYYGQLIRGDGCYISELTEKPFRSYQTLVR